MLSLSRRLLSPFLSGTRACVTGGGGDFSFLSSLLALFFSSLPLSSPLFIARGRNRFSLSHDLSLFFSSFSHSLFLFLAFFLGRVSLSLSLSRDGNFRREERFLFLFSLFFGNYFLLSPSLPSLALPFSLSLTFFSLSIYSEYLD